MKTFKILTVTLLFIFIKSFANAQDPAFYQAKVEKYQKWHHNGRAVTISGIAAIALASGFGLAANSAERTGDEYLLDGNSDKSSEYYQKRDNFNTVSTIFTVAGLGAIIPGSIYWKIGKRKTRQYQIELDNSRSGLYYAPGQVGLKFAFKF